METHSVVEYPMNEERAALKAAISETLAEKGLDDEGRPYCTQNSPAVVRKIEDANKAVRLAMDTEVKATVKGKEAGKRLIALREAVKAESPGVAWSVWCADFLGHFGIRTIERYIALIEPPKPTADAVTENDVVTPKTPDATNAARQKRHRDKLNELRGKPTKETPGGSPRRRLEAIVAKLSESEAEEVLVMVEKWKARR
jgi:hypothetical protein